MRQAPTRPALRGTIAPVAGAIVNEIEVRLPGIDKRPDPEIASDLAAVLALEFGAVADGIRISVQNGAVTLEGQVASKSQRLRASELASQMRDVIAVNNDLELDPASTETALRRRIEAAFRRSAEIDANNIEVEADDDRIVLSGAVRSWAERQEAEHVARQTPGVQVVEILPEFRRRGAELLGISVDGAWCHQAFAKARNLHFPILADFHPKGAVATAYGCYMEEVGEAARALFLIDEQGTIVWSYQSPLAVNPGADGILDALDKMPAVESLDVEAKSARKRA